LARVVSKLVVSNLKKAFVGAVGQVVPVLNGVCLEAEAGEMLAVVGPSGAGKSTLLHLIGGLEPADAGTITLDDFEVTVATEQALAEYRAAQLGFAFQFHHLLPDLTAEENVAMPLFINRRSKESSLGEARKLLHELGLSAQARQLIGSLSGGEQQRVAIARAMVAKPRLLLADEPTGNLDASIGEEIENILLRYCREYSAIVVVATHNEGLAAKCDRRVGLLKSGQWSMNSGQWSVVSG
jgi:ABC-type lipoprotein export system ATPase subunit